LPSALRISFGAFEVEPANFQLRRSGRAVRIERIPMELLLILIEKEGKLVNRSEIVERIWGKDVYLDADSAVNTAVRKLRTVLRDNATRPKYIETVPAKGYRLIAPLRTSGARAAEPMRDSQTRLAVLPLQSFSDDRKHAYFTDGTTEEIIAQLGCLHPEIGVIARTSVMRYKDGARSVRQIGRELNVQYVLEGSMRYESGRVRVTVQLIEAATESHLWAESYERPLDQILDLQRRVAQQISARIRSELSSNPAQNRRRRRVSDPGEGAAAPFALKLAPRAIAAPSAPARAAAYEAYATGRFFWNKKTAEGVDKSLECFREAVRLDDRFALGYAGLADAYIFLGILGFRPPAEVYPKAEEAALAALAVDPSLAEAHTSLADVRKGYHWDWSGAEADYRRAIRNPSYAVARHWYAEHLSAMGRPEEAIREIETARQLDPLSVSINAFVGYIYYRARRYDTAERTLKRTIELNPDMPITRWFLGLVYVQQAEMEHAVREFAAAVQLSGSAPVHLAALGFGLSRSGKLAEAQNVLKRLDETRATRYVSPFDFAVVHTGVGDNDAAFDWLERSYRERVMRIRELPEPLFDRLRPDPRFGDLVSRIGLPDRHAAQA